VRREARGWRLEAQRCAEAAEAAEAAELFKALGAMHHRACPRATARYRRRKARCRGQTRKLCTLSTQTASDWRQRLHGVVAARRRICSMISTAADRVGPLVSVTPRKPAPASRGAARRSGAGPALQTITRWRGQDRRALQAFAEARSALFACDQGTAVNCKVRGLFQAR
jgi:hypothetical protein